MAGDELPDCRLGAHFYKYISWDDPNQSGLFFRHPPSERDWASLLANQATPSGKPSVENLRNDDLRLFLDNFDGGEGQTVFRAGDLAGERRFSRSDGVDFSVPGQFTLERAMRQRGLTGAAVTTREGDTWSDVTGTSTVDGTDRKLNAVGDIVKRSLGVLAAGAWQADFYAKVNPPGAYDGDAFTIRSGQIDDLGTSLLLKSDGATAARADTPPVAAQVTVTFTLDLANVQSPTDANARVHLTVLNAAGDVVHDSGELQIYRTEVVNGPVERSIKFHANGSATYTYRVKRSSAYSCGLELVSATVDVHDDKTARCSIYDETAAAEVVHHDIDMGNLTTFRRIAALGFTADGAHTYSMRLKRQAGVSRALWLDKATYVSVGIKTPWLCELGQGARLWLADWGSAAASGIFYWDAQNEEWVSPGTLGVATNKKPIAMSGSDFAEYVLHGDSKVYSCKAAATPVAYTAAFTAPVGIAVAAARLFVLTEDNASGTRLWQLDVDDGSPPLAVPGAPVYTAGAGTGYAAPKAQTVADTEIPRRMAAMQNGVTFFVNHGAHCVLYAYDVGTPAGTPVTDFIPGFQGRSIVHALGLSYIGGGFPAVDTDGVTKMRPAVFVVDHSTGSAPVQLDVPLHRDGDAGSRIVDMQLYGPDLWVLTQVSGATNKVRLWRISLTIAGGTFLAHEIEPPDQTGSVRGLALNWRTKVLAWAGGNPWVEQDEYVVDGSPYLDSSWFDFALTERKILLKVAVDGDFPDGTSLEILYATNGEDNPSDFDSAGVLTRSGNVDISDLDEAVLFRRLKLRAKPQSTDDTKTPTVRSISALAFCIDYRKSWTVLLNCMDQTAAYHTGGQVAGSVLSSNVFALAEAGGLVEFIDYFSSKRMEDAQSYRVIVSDPQMNALGRGESAVQCTLLER